MNYNPIEIEKKWQNIWSHGDIVNSGPKKFIVPMFPYPSGSIHMGHMRCYTISDVIARHWRNKGYSVCHPMGWDSFGAPAENTAIQKGIHPRDWTNANIQNMKSQMIKMGMIFDWDKEVSTCEVDYWKWEQRFFIDMWKAGFIEKKIGIVNWDPIDQSVIANEQVINGRGWRSGAVIEQREMVQYYFKTTSFAEDMYESISEVESTWPGIITRAQKQFIKNGTQKGEVSIPYSDWCVSRQRYWGTPIPMINCKNCGTVPNEDVPVTAPEDVIFNGKGNPIDNHPIWKNVVCPSCGGDAEKETDTMDTFVQSSWYFVRYISDFDGQKFDWEKIQKWFPIDYYIGGPEHAISHMIYSRFFWRIFKKMEYIPPDSPSDPFKNVITQGMVKKDGRKMSKSSGNGVSPEDVVDKWGCDIARAYIMFAAPSDQDMEWDDRNIIGVQRFVNKFWASYFRISSVVHVPNEVAEKNAISKIDKMNSICDRAYSSTYKFNTVVSSCMEAYNAISSQTNPEIWKMGYREMIKNISPIMPHICSEMNDVGNI